MEMVLFPIEFVAFKGRGMMVGSVRTIPLWERVQPRRSRVDGPGGRLPTFR